ncbi:hypothetical protein GGR42_000399 [Saonia flava]|uniref:Methane oxygenase PmoA n=1 Tax=Saonia flava TaxID=523696 RepID=A0A846QRW9_9FLAO|nr:PmoA family protein [Saonia flava]NJB69937.1 hypothetical protein [Saonia flava]
MHDKKLIFAICALILVACSESKKKKSLVTSEKQSGSLVLKMEHKPLLSYKYETNYPPIGVDSSYKRSGYIHPLRTPAGKVLTRIQPEDHYHHYGIWNPWTHTLYDGDTIDFWNLKKGEGTVRFAKFKEILDNGYTALHEHVVLKDNKNEVALNEWQTVKITPSEDPSTYTVDLTFTYECATDKPFLILEYRYAGFGWRATEEWTNKNSEILASNGKTRVDADGSTARWCLVQGTLGNEYGGALMLSHPNNFNHPEPLRIWPVDQYDRGDVFACFCTTKNTNWLFEPGKTYTLNYQLVVFDGKLDAEKSEQYWQQFAKTE